MHIELARYEKRFQKELIAENKIKIEFITPVFIRSSYEDTRY